MGKLSVHHETINSTKAGLISCLFNCNNGYKVGGVKLGVGELIRQNREKKGISQSELAKRLGITRSFMSKLEKEQRTISTDALIKISDILDYPIEDFYPHEQKQSEDEFAEWHGFIKEAERRGYTPDDFKKLLHIIDEMKSKG